jgi:SAM-dependent methyltransferase
MSAPLLFDRALLHRRLAKAEGDDFIATRVIEDMGDRVATVLRPFARMADVGTPTSRLAQTLVQPGREVLRVAPMVEPPALGVTTVVGDAERLPLHAGAFDLVVSALALQHVNDLPGALVQIRQALKPDGLFLGAWLGGNSLHELREALGAAETELSGGVSPRVAPFVEVRDGGALLQRAGFALPVSDTDTLKLRYDNLFGLLADLRRFGAANPLVARLRRPTGRRLFLRAAEIYAARFADSDGRVRATVEILHLAGWAPHASQQKPLQPGSARMRLADALKPPL